MLYLTNTKNRKQAQMLIGITRIENAIVRDILRHYKQEYSFYYYGERMSGTYTDESALNILVVSNSKVPIELLNEIEDRFLHGGLPYNINVTDKHELPPELYNEIKNGLIPIFE